METSERDAPADEPRTEAPVIADPLRIGPIRRFWRRPAVRRTRRVLLALLAVFVVVVGTSITNALVAPGTDPTSVRLAEWGRDHGLGGVLDWLEKQQYEHNQPRIGGTPADGIPPAAGALAPTATRPTGPPRLPAPGRFRCWPVIRRYPAKARGRPW